MKRGLIRTSLLALCFVVGWAQAAEMVQATVGRAKIVRLPAPADRVAVGDPKVADYTVINPRELYVLGKTVGTTNIIYWDKKGKSSTLSMNVGVDVEPLEQTLRQVLPKEKDIHVTSAANSIVLNGFVNNTVAGEAAYNLADAYAKNIARSLGQSGGSTAVSGQGGVAPPVFGTQVINLLKVRDAQQVMLEVRVAEVSKDLLEQIGVSFIGGTNFINPEYAGDGFRWAVPPSTASGGLVGWLLANTMGAKVDMKETDALVKILAAPTIVAVSGQEGRFLVGGKAFLPVQQGSSANSAISLQEQDYGIGLKFVPTVLENGRISLKVSPEVSELTNKTITSSTGSSNTATFPVFETRQASTTVQLQNGQSLVIGGLLRNNVAEVVSSIPLLGQLPYIGALFRSSQFISNKTELIIVVRPLLVEATAKSPELPTDNFIQPTRTEFFLEGKMEGTPPKPKQPVGNAVDPASTAIVPKTEGAPQ